MRRSTSRCIRRVPERSPPGGRTTSRTPRSTRRHQALEKLQERIGTEINSRRVGTTTEVLIEGKNKGRWSGRSRGNTLVHVDVAEGVDLLGRMVDVTVTAATPWFLIGEATGAPQ